MAVSKWPCLTLSRVNVMSCQNLIGSYASTHSTFNLIGSCNRNPNTQSHKDRKIQSHKDTYAQTTDIQLKKRDKKLVFL